MTPKQFLFSCLTTAFNARAKPVMMSMTSLTAAEADALRLMSGVTSMTCMTAAKTDALRLMPGRMNMTCLTAGERSRPAAPSLSAAGGTPQCPAPAPTLAAQLALPFPVASTKLQGPAHVPAYIEATYTVVCNQLQKIYMVSGVWGFLGVCGLGVIS